MKKTKQIETLVMEKLAFLQERYGFMSPIVNQDRWCTTISYLAADISIEIELDWRDLNMFVLVTNLENGRLPSGYYVSNGKISRMHLEKVLKGALGVNPEYIKKVLGFMPDHRKRGPSTFEKRLDAYLVLIRDHITAICEKGARLFD